MCGIAGLVDQRGLDPAAVQQRLNAALERLKPRGPDGQGWWADGNCALAHTRLAIIDLSSAGAQPMQREGLVITFNGEIFNFAEVKRALQERGHAFRSNSDTEVLLAGWRQWGPALLPKLTGMWAFAIWDPETRTLHAARDRFGEKPFHYAVRGASLAFGSDLIACEAMLGETRPVEPQALRALFEIRFVPEPLTIARGVAKLPPGHLLTFSPQGLRVAPWYDLARATPPAVTDPVQAEQELRRRFDAAVRNRLVSDVPVGVFLSGGIDSALVAASVAAQGVTPKTFTVGFSGESTLIDERADAARVARHLKADHTEISVPAAEAALQLDHVFLGLDEPFADASAVPTFLVSQATRKEVTVVLTGDGADEVFAGYRRYWGEIYAASWLKLPGFLRAPVKGAVMRLPEGKESWALEAGRRARRFVATAHADPIVRQAAWMREVETAELDRLLRPAAEPAWPLEGTIRAIRDHARMKDPINAMLAADASIVLPGDMLVKVDRMSMASALETRSPFLDQNIVEWAFALPGEMKLGRKGAFGVEGKQILRNAFRDRLPAEVFRRRKRGFEMPVKPMLLGPAKDRLAAACDAVRLGRQGIFSPHVVEGWRRELAEGRSDPSWKLWTMLAFQEWARLHKRPEALG